MSPDTGVMIFTTDAVGNVVAETDAAGRVKTKAYDALDRLTQIQDAGLPHTSLTYDQGINGIGRLTGMTDPTGTTVWAYDAQDRVLQTQQTTLIETAAPDGPGKEKDKTTPTISSVLLTTTMTYDGAGRLNSITYPSGQQITLGYGSGAQPESMSGTNGVLLQQMAHATFGAVTSWKTENETLYTRDYDQNGRLSRIGRVPSSLADAEATEIAYDDASRISDILETGQSAQTFGYDVQGRLTDYAAGTAAQSYLYDATGNRMNLTTEGGSTTYLYNAVSNHLTSRSGLQNTNYAYDATGNLINDQTFTYGYDVRGRLASATHDQQGWKVAYGVNGLGQRVSKTGANLATGANLFVYDGAGHLLGEYDAAGQPIQETVWLGDLPVATMTPSGHAYIKADHLGAPQTINLADGSRIWRWDRDPFGNGVPSSSSGFVYNPRFPGAL